MYFRTTHGSSALLLLSVILFVQASAAFAFTSTHSSLRLFAPSLGLPLTPHYSSSSSKGVCGRIAMMAKSEETEKSKVKPAEDNVVQRLLDGALQPEDMSKLGEDMGKLLGLNSASKAGHYHEHHILTSFSRSSSV